MLEIHVVFFCKNKRINMFPRTPTDTPPRITSNPLWISNILATIFKIFINDYQLALSDPKLLRELARFFNIDPNYPALSPIITTIINSYSDNSLTNTQLTDLIIFLLQEEYYDLVDFVLSVIRIRLNDMDDELRVADPVRLLFDEGIIGFEAEEPDDLDEDESDDPDTDNSDDEFHAGESDPDELGTVESDDSGTDEPGTVASDDIYIYEFNDLSADEFDELEQQEARIFDRLKANQIACDVLTNLKFIPFISRISIFRDPLIHCFFRINLSAIIAYFCPSIDVIQQLLTDQLAFDSHLEQQHPLFNYFIAKFCLYESLDLQGELFLDLLNSLTKDFNLETTRAYFAFVKKLFPQLSEYLSQRGDEVYDAIVEKSLAKPAYYLELLLQHGLDVDCSNLIRFNPLLDLIDMMVYSVGDLSLGHLRVFLEFLNSRIPLNIALNMPFDYDDETTTILMTLCSAFPSGGTHFEATVKLLQSYGLNIHLSLERNQTMLDLVTNESLKISLINCRAVPAAALTGDDQSNLDNLRKSFANYQTITAAVEAMVNRGLFSNGPAAKGNTETPTESHYTLPHNHGISS